MPPKQSETSWRRVVRREREVEIMGLRKAGLNLREIAGAMEKNHNKRAAELCKAGKTEDEVAAMLPRPPGWRSVSKIIRAVMARLREEADAHASEIVSLAGARLDKLQQAFWPAAIRGDARAGRMILDIEERRAKLLGSDARPGQTEPQRTVITVSFEGRPPAEATPEATPPAAPGAPDATGP